MTWASDGHLYTAWGDGGGFGGDDHEGRVAMGIGRVEGGPEDFHGVNVNGGKNPEHPASFPISGKTAGILATGSKLYAWLNMQDGAWPDVNFRLAWSADRGATWATSPWAFEKGGFKPASFLNFGQENRSVPRALGRYVYFFGFRQGDETRAFVGRVPARKMLSREAYEFLSGFDVDGRPIWSASLDDLYVVFTDGRGGQPTVSYVPAWKRYLFTSFHSGPGQVGVFEAPQPWGPWSAIAYLEDWGGMGATGEGLTCSFPLKWMKGDTAWCVFSVYGEGARRGIEAHDRFNVVKVTFERRLLP